MRWLPEIYTHARALKDPRRAAKDELWNMAQGQISCA